ncbi:hypothetical protein U5A82_20650 [Sphingobium sp. CR2-8]|uniref:hypothetical protein n=1 Tax=Sphingobium sp. CR2-8 TaxID=1306534 RepID=UPI002DBC96CD|nr:hypothetical protein [Sphingobium sp. CR2-8]MEC3912794.1 hypothetical protein [Sphingobium sp. CR2-8]
MTKTGQSSAHTSQIPSSPDIYRIISHQACTGGTLISRFLASYRKVALISEVSPDGPDQFVRFDPFMPISQLGSLSIVKSRKQRDALFTDQLALSQRWCRMSDRILILREHAHSTYMVSARKIRGIQRCIPTGAVEKSIITVRHPISSYLSLIKSFPHEYLNFDHYCERYIIYIRKNASVPRYQYEDFCQHTAVTAKKILGALHLEDRDLGIQGDWASVTLTGNSGRHRHSNVIMIPTVEKEVISHGEKLGRESAACRQLCDLLEYDADYRRFAKSQNRIAGDMS